MRVGHALWPWRPVSLELPWILPGRVQVCRSLGPTRACLHVIARFTRLPFQEYRATCRCLAAVQSCKPLLLGLTALSWPGTVVPPPWHAAPERDKPGHHALSRASSCAPLPLRRCSCSMAGLRTGCHKTSLEGLWQGRVRQRTADGLWAVAARRSWFPWPKFLDRSWRFE